VQEEHILVLNLEHFVLWIEPYKINNLQQTYPKTHCYLYAENGGLFTQTSE